jgi:glucokinase
MGMRGRGEALSIGIDLGGTKVSLGLLNSQGKILISKKFLTGPENGADRITSDILDAVNSLKKETKKSIHAIGVGAAGQIDRKGIVKSAPNLPFTNYPLQKKLEEELEAPVMVTNDVRAATYGEWRYGSGKGVNDLVVIFVGTGIGGGVVSGGRLLEGCSNNLGEIGHITLVSGGRQCRCPNQGCIEAYAGGWAIAERAIERVRLNQMMGERLRSLGGEIAMITAKTVSQAFHEGDGLARELVDETGRYLGSGVVGVVNAFNPCVVVMGGGIIEGLPQLISVVDGIVRERALKPGLEKLSIVKAELGGEAGVIGAGGLALNKVEETK